MEIENLPENKKIILFDGVCNLCNHTVNFLISQDKHDQFRFVSLQSELGNKICNYLNINVLNTDSIVLYIPKKAYFVKANAVIEILNLLGGLYSFTKIFKLFPKSISNFIYDFVAKNRYKWFGKKEICRLPTEYEKAKFL